MSPFTVIPAPGAAPSLPGNIPVAEELRERYNYDKGKFVRIPGAPRHLPVLGRTGQKDAEWWWQQMSLWAQFGSPSLEPLPNAHILWVISQLLPSDTRPWQDWWHAFSYGIGVTLGHLQMQQGQYDLQAFVRNILPTLQDEIRTYSGSEARLVERFPRR